jgi:hypothetical protein
VRDKFARKNYNQRDWKAYDKALVGQGSITIWFNEEAISQCGLHPIIKTKRIEKILIMNNRYNQRRTFHEENKI